MAVSSATWTHCSTSLQLTVLQIRTAPLIQNGTWAATTSKQMGEILGTMKNIHVLEADVTIKSALKDNQEAELDALADAIDASLQ